MADQRITELDELLEVNVASDDVLPIVDLGASQTKKIQVVSLIEAGFSLAGSGTIDLGKLNQSSVTKIGTTALANSGVTSAKLANNSSVAVDTTEPVSGNYQGRGYLDTTNNVFKIYNAGSFVPIVVTASGIQDDAVVTAKIAANAITTNKISASGLGTAAYAAGSITAEKIASGTIASGQIASDAVTPAAIITNAIESRHLSSDSVTTAAIASGSVTEAKLADGSVTNAKLAANAVTNSNIVDATITYAKLNLSAGDIPGSAIAAGSITVSGLTDGSIETVKLADGAVTGAKIASGTIDAGQLATNSVTTDAISAGAVGTSELADGAVTYAKIQGISATDRILGRSSAGSGTVEEIPCTNAGRNIIGAADAATQRTFLGLGDLAIATGTWTNGSSFSGTSTGTNTGDQTIQLTGDVLGIGTASFETTINNEAINAAKLASNAVTTVKIADDAVTGGKLADQSSTLVQAGIPTGSGDFIGQQYINTDDDISYYWNGSAWDSQSVSIPEATDLISGTVKVGTGLQMNANGQLDHLNTVVAGTYTKITLDTQGHATNGALLEAADIPELDASKITSGSFGSDRLAANSVTADQLADNGIAQVSETAPNPQFSGQWWVNPNDRSTYIWVGNVGPTLETSNGYWLNLGYGNLQNENLRFAGTYNASGNTIATVTSYSTQAGLDIGEALNAPVSSNNGLYYIVTASGVGTGFAPNSAIAAGDWVVSLGQGTNWEILDFASAVAGVADGDVLVDGPSLVPAASGITTQEDFNEQVWAKVQVATTGVNGIVRASTEVEVSASGIMTIGTVDDGTY
jgi:hypothetical protein